MSDNHKDDSANVPNNFPTPERPYFGRYQIRNLADIKDDMKIIKCHGYLDKEGEPVRLKTAIHTVFQEPYQEKDGSWWYNATPQFTDFLDEISLGNMSVVAYRQNNMWNNTNWIEHFREGVVIESYQDEGGVPNHQRTLDELFEFLKQTEDVIKTKTKRDCEEVRKTPRVTFDQIGGQQVAKSEIIKLSAALNDPERYQRWGTKPVRGICLYGPPGTGKTLLMRALATETNVHFENVDSSSLMSMWHGESEKNVDALFRKVRKKGGILFFDEADALAPSRGGDTHEASKRIVNALNRNMDGFKGSDKIIVCFATNRLGDMDSAVMRPGRIDRLIKVPLPDKEGRAEIFDIHIKNAEKLAKRNLFKEIDMTSIIEITDGFSGADAAEIIRRTLEAKVLEEDSGGDVSLVLTSDIISEIKSYERTKGVKKKFGFGQ